MAKFEIAIRYASGTAKVLASSDLDLNPEDANTIVIRPPDGQKLNRVFTKLMDDLKKRDLNAIPEQNIGIAIVKVNLDIDCNPRRKPTVIRRGSSRSQSQSQVSHRLLAPETQSLTLPPASSGSQSSQARRIPATLTPKTQASSSCGEIKTEVKAAKVLEGG